MKTIGKLKLTQLSKTELSKREQNRIVGGVNCCICGCHGPSSSFDNYNANISGGSGGYTSPGGGASYGSFG